ncbi:hypothetical protein Cgig2_031619 [Carnegiea gigantea]|uniref:Uncharacterized protein n=1 Tax=Carnegiea gigantea TaxID=171969 RepID=A0A9Q1K0T5_9CARY|nr:hypothetical protein Cgig2_031619 [Carnegiea gigantea]
MREGCNAMVRFRRTNNGRYTLFKFHEGHTHLLATPKKLHIAPDQVDILPPKQCNTKGSGKRTKGGKEKAIEQQGKRLRLCKACGQQAYHYSRNCPTTIGKTVFLHTSNCIYPWIYVQQVFFAALKLSVLIERVGKYSPHLISAARVTFPTLISMGNDVFPHLCICGYCVAHISVEKFSSL